MGIGFGFGAIALKVIKQGKPFPFGPFLALGAILAVFYGEFLWSAYWAFVGKLYG